MHIAPLLAAPMIAAMAECSLSTHIKRAFRVPLEQNSEMTSTI
jgi:hypothetical protein